MRYLLIFFLLVFSFLSFSQEKKQVSFRQLTVAQGLSQNSVVAVEQDSFGYMWFATQDGLNKYDGKSFTYFNKQFEDVTRPNYSKLGKLYIDKAGDLWIISISGVLEKFENNEQTFNKISAIKDVSVILQKHNEDYFIGTYGNGLFKIDAKLKDTIQIFENRLKDLYVFDMHQSSHDIFLATNEAIFQVNNSKLSTVEVENNSKNFSTITSSKDGTIWLGSFGNGLFNKRKTATNFTKFNHTDLPSLLNIQDILIDKDDNLWIATYGKGLYFLNTKTNKVSHFTENKNNPFAIQYNDILCIYQDFTGAIWLGTDGAGLSYYDEHLSKFNVITNNQVPENVSVDVVRAIAVDKEKIWLGTSGKGLTTINTEKNQFKTYTSKNSNLKSNRIMSLLFDNNELWIGHQGQGLQLMKKSGVIQTIKEFKNQTIWKIYKHNTNQLWLCTRDSGLILFNKTKGIVNHFTAENSKLNTNNIRTIEKGDNNLIYVGTEDKGLYVLNLENEAIEAVEEISDKIKSLYFDGRILWIGTNGNGIKSYTISNELVNNYTTDYGLANNVVYAILPDKNGNLWLSSNKGISKFNPFDKKMRYVENYTKNSGLQDFEFNTGAYYKDDDGTLYFGGLEGVNWFNPIEISINEAKPKTVISKFEVFGVTQPQNTDVILKHNQNTITFTFAGLHFSEPDKNLYRYKLINHDEDWTFPDYNNVAHYTNLPPNDYTFLVTSSNYEGVWNKEPTTFRFSILKPWYKTNLAYIIYALLLALGLYAIYNYFRFKWKLETQLRLEHAEANRLKQLDEFKKKLYTNISHEFRTPLTLISGPIDQQLSKNNLNNEDREVLGLVKQNANRLLNLVNQMLDLSLIDSGQLKLKVAEGNLNMLLNQIVAAFQFKAKDKQITINSRIKSLKDAWYDIDVIEKITSNLLSNAIKYAPNSSEVILDANELDNALVLSVINVNASISNKDFDKLFQRFYQNDSSIDGVGVGLALVKELVDLSKGSIIANTVDDNKIQFTVTLPIDRDSFDDTDVENNEAVEKEVFNLDIASSHDQSLMLIVEDDTDIRNFVNSIFKDTYQIIEAENGKKGIELAIQYIPDVIISDIMMPVQDGIELCNALKYNELTSHIPIILLTAKVGEENEIEGLKTGADAYITKPFNNEKLQLRVQMLIENRKQLQKHFSKDFAINPEFSMTSAESDFLKRLKEVLDTKITNSGFTSEAFAEAMLMSRTQLHRKLKAIVGMSSTEFIRAQRLKLSLDLLKTTDSTVSEIAYQVGFNTPSYFIKCFKEVYGMTPNDYI